MVVMQRSILREESMISRQRFAIRPDVSSPCPHSLESPLVIHPVGMMATVSELSMYQATAMKLQQQKRTASRKLEESRWRAAKNEPPTDDVYTELHRRERDRVRIQETSPSRSGTESRVASSLIRTTAEPRPNAYIPDVAHGLGIPKPYSSLAPFKPVEAGSTMRHYRLPKPPAIVI